MTERSSPRRLPRLRLTGAGALTALGALLVPLSLFLTWFEITSGENAGVYTGWFSFHRTDRVLALLALAALVAAILAPSRRVAIARLVLGLLSILVVGREVLDPPVGGAVTELRGGAYLGIAGSLLVAAGGMLALLAPAPLPPPRARRRDARRRWARHVAPAPGPPGRAPPTSSSGAFRPSCPGLRPIPHRLRAGPAGHHRPLGRSGRPPGAAGRRRVRRGAVQGRVGRLARHQPGRPDRPRAGHDRRAAAVRGRPAFARGLPVAVCGLAAMALVSGRGHAWGMPMVALFFLLIVPWSRSGLEPRRPAATPSGSPTGRGPEQALRARGLDPGPHLGGGLPGRGLREALGRAGWSGSPGAP